MRPKQKNAQRIQLYLDKASIQLLNKLARNAGMSRSSFIEGLLRLATGTDFIHKIPDLLIAQALQGFGGLAQKASSLPPGDP